MKVAEVAMKEDEDVKEEVVKEEDTGETTNNDAEPDPQPSKPEALGNFSILRRASSASSDKDEFNVHVVTRIRPLNPQEKEREDTIVTQYPGDGAIWVDNQGKTKSFAFHGVFEPGCTQAQVFKNCGMKHLLNMALDGYACTAFAFGQTGSGKTYTMTGPVTPENTTMTQERSIKDIACYGLIQFSFAYLMDIIAGQQDTSYAISASYLEIYNEQVQDLLNLSAYDMVQVRWSKSLGFYVENLFVKEIETLEDLMDVLEEGMKNRAMAEHNVNEHSSRSHSILTVYLDRELISDGITVTKHGKVSFVDLAGSEKVKDTGSTGDTLLEATNINRSLLTLGNCISSLSDPKKRTGHIPFRDSKLTKLLADGLGGSGVTLMIACVTPSGYNLSETLNTLRYAKRARKIKNKPIVKIDPREELILKLQREMKLLQQENRFLRDQLEFPYRDKPRFPLPNTADEFQKRNHKGEVQPFLPAIPRISTLTDDSKITSPPERAVSDNSLYGMLQEYMVENEALRSENQNLISQHNTDEREHRIVLGENDKLNRKFEDLSRFMMSSPSYGSTLFSRTNSGRSNQSLQTFGSSVTPLSQQMSVFYNVGKQQSMKPANGYMQYGMASKPLNGPRMAWNSTPPQKNAKDLPPLRGSPKNFRKAPVIRQTVPRGNQGAPPVKWVKATTYATQLKRKQTINKTTSVPSHATVRKESTGDVMKDFPMRDYDLSKNNFNPLYNIASSGYTDSEESGHVSSLRDATSVNRLPADFHVRFGKSGYYHLQNQPAGGGALPDEAYKPQEISPKGSMTKELSANSLRKLNDRMRQEMRALDDEINSYQKTMNKQRKEKITAT